MGDELCKECRYVLKRLLQFVEGGTYAQFEQRDYTFTSFESSAKAGCLICAIIYAGFSRTELEIAREKKLSAICVYIFKHNSTMGSYQLDGCLKYYSDERDLQSGNFQYVALSSVDIKPAMKLGVAKDESHLGQSTGCHQSQELAKEWYKTCLKQHPDCKSSGNFEIPSRLLAIRPGGINLILPSALFGRPPYATLSHCWGTAQHLKLEKGTVDDFRVGIPESQLSKTFKEAVIVARRLDIQYLWIDFLCIVQNDHEDWIRESSRMSSVYGNSSINIAASGAMDGTEGCFFDRDPRFIQGFANVPVKTHIDMRTRVFDVKNPASPYQSIFDSPLCSRGWAFQERILAPRTLHFTKSQIFWKCKGSYLCESFPKATPKLYKPQLRSLKLDLPALQLPQLWYFAMTIYSNSKLTYAKDRLVAICSVAKWVQDQTKDEYLAGMWRYELEKQLCWRVKEEENNTLPVVAYLPPPEYLAPTWSWASIIKPIQFSAVLRKPASHSKDTLALSIRIFSSHTTPLAPGNPLGQVTGGKLCVGVKRVFCGIEDELSGRIVESSDRLKVMSIGKYRPTWDEPTRARNILYFVPIILLLRSGLGDEDEVLNFSEGIVLAAADRGKRGEFRRIGYYESHGIRGGSEPDESVFEDFAYTKGQERIITII